MKNKEKAGAAQLQGSMFETEGFDPLPKKEIPKGAYSTDVPFKVDTAKMLEELSQVDYLWDMRCWDKLYDREEVLAYIESPTHKNSGRAGHIVETLRIEGVEKEKILQAIMNNKKVVYKYRLVKCMDTDVDLCPFAKEFPNNYSARDCTNICDKGKNPDIGNSEKIKKDQPEGIIASNQYMEAIKQKEAIILKIKGRDWNLPTELINTSIEQMGFDIKKGKDKALYILKKGEDKAALIRNFNIDYYEELKKTGKCYCTFVSIEFTGIKDRAKALSNKKEQTT